LPIPNRMLWSAAGLLSDFLGVPAELGDDGFQFFRMAVSAWAMVLIIVLYLFRRKEKETPPVEQSLKQPLKQPKTADLSIEHLPSKHDQTSD
jgi:hypothetical protein